MQVDSWASNWWTGLRHELRWTKTEYPALMDMVRDDYLVEYLSSDTNEMPEWVRLNENSLFIQNNSAVFYEDDGFADGGVFEILPHKGNELDFLNGPFPYNQLPSLEKNGDPNFKSFTDHEPKASYYLYDYEVDWHETRFYVPLDADTLFRDDLLNLDGFTELLREKGGYLIETPGHRSSGHWDLLAGCTFCNPLQDTSFSCNPLLNYSFFSHVSGSYLRAALIETMQLFRSKSQDLDLIEEVLLENFSSLDDASYQRVMSECDSVLRELFTSFADRLPNLKKLIYRRK